MLALATNYREDKGDAIPYLSPLAEAGFSYTHWAHEWNTDYVYTDEEVTRIGAALRDCDLHLRDLHSSQTERASWGSRDEGIRRAGIDLLLNRLRMTAALGGEAMVVHMPAEPGPDGVPHYPFDLLRRSLEALAEPAREYRVALALENSAPDNMPAIAYLLEQYPPEILGLCYDSGHGHIAGNGLDRLEVMADRLLVLHLHDNNGQDDLHNLPFSGTGDWNRLARILAAAPYDGPLTMEASHLGEDNAAFLRAAWEQGCRLEQMVEAARPVRPDRG